MSDGFRIPVMTKRVALTNLVPAINGIEGFTIGGSSNAVRSAEASTEHTKYAAQSLKMSIGSDCAEITASSTGTYPLDASHIYYFRIEGYQEVAHGTAEMYFPIAEPHPFNTPVGEAGKWNIYSAVCDRSAFSSGNHRFRIDFNNGNTYANTEIWYDGVMIIDLTAACGEGNEPTKEWCDANIPYFTDSHTLDIPVSSPIQGLVEGLTIPEGVVTQITDASGRVLWSAVRYPEGMAVLEVEKIVSNTYAGETTYTAEEFILLDIYPKTNGTVKITYGGLTKTITDTSGAEEPNAQQVLFGTFNGVSDSVTTPASGELTIDGDCYAFGCGSFYDTSKKLPKCCNCVTAIKDFGKVEHIPQCAFSTGSNSCCNKIEQVVIPSSVMSIGDWAFNSMAISVTMLATTPPTMIPTIYTSGGVETADYDQFSVDLVTIVVPKGCGETYKAAEGWSKYADKIVEAS